jgi:hypothetical protein
MFHETSVARAREALLDFCAAQDADDAGRGPTQSSLRRTVPANQRATNTAGTRSGKAARTGRAANRLRRPIPSTGATPRGVWQARRKRFQPGCRRPAQNHATVRCAAKRLQSAGWMPSSCSFRSIVYSAISLPAQTQIRHLFCRMAGRDFRFRAERAFLMEWPWRSRSTSHHFRASS